jgi:hypothetical protein
MDQSTTSNSYYYENHYTTIISTSRRLLVDLAVVVGTVVQYVVVARGKKHVGVESVVHGKNWAGKRILRSTARSLSKLPLSFFLNVELLTTTAIIDDDDAKEGSGARL